MAGEAHWKPHLGKESVLPRQPCFAPRTAAAPPTTGGSGRGCRDLKAVNKGNRSKRPGGEGGWGRGGGSLPKPAAEDCQPCPHTPRTHTPPHTQTETERQRRSSWAELPLRPSPPAFTHLPLAQEVGPHGQASPPPSSLTALSSRALPAPHSLPCPIHAVRPRLSGHLWQYPESLRPGLVT